MHESLKAAFALCVCEGESSVNLSVDADCKNCMKAYYLVASDPLYSHVFNSAELSALHLVMHS